MRLQSDLYYQLINQTIIQIDLPIHCETDDFCIQQQNYDLEIIINEYDFLYHSAILCASESDIHDWSLYYENNTVGMNMYVQITTYDVLGRQCMTGHASIMVSI